MEEELRMLQLLEQEHPINTLRPSRLQKKSLRLKNKCEIVYVDAKVRQYLLQIVHETRSHSDLSLGGGPRATIALFRASQAMAAIRGRNYVQPDDVKKIIAPRDGA